MKTLLAGNWKMKLSAAQSAQLAGQLAQLSRSLKKTEIWVAPSFTAISQTAAAAKGSAVKVGGQNAHWDPSGAFTGEVSVPMLKEAACDFTIIGHSERRHIFLETNEQSAKRAAAALKQGLVTIFCVGETLEERQKGITHKVLQTQMVALMESMSEKCAPLLIIAYEPVWAIGTGVVAKKADIADAHAAIAKIWKSSFPIECPPILYGGSVTSQNLREILETPLVAGALIGGASLTYESMEALARISEAVPG